MTKTTISPTTLLTTPASPRTFSGGLTTAVAAVTRATKAPNAAPVPQPNTALLTFILTLGTFIIAYFLRIFRTSQFLGRRARKALGDFGVPLAIVIMVAFDTLAITDSYTAKLDVPDGLEPTDASLRGWLINPLGPDVAWWLPIMCAVPSLMVFVLIFMESQITAIIVNKKERNMQKGGGYHWDLFLIGCINMILVSFGLPFVTAATLRSVSHVSSLAEMSQTHAPGEKAKCVGVKEQRVTTILVSITIGASVMMGPVLRLIPLATLFGVFLYMGVSSMSGVQLFDRLTLMFVLPKHHPPVGYVRKVRTFRMHLYTLVQLLCFAVLWAVKSTAVALAFPFFLILLVPLRRYLLPRVFTDQELHELDKEDVDSMDVDKEEQDFYEEMHMPV